MHHICLGEADAGDAALTLGSLPGEPPRPPAPTKKITKYFFCGVFSAFVRVQELENVLRRWPKLRELDLCGNPVCKIRKYRDHLTTICKCLGDYFFLICSFRLKTVKFIDDAKKTTCYLNCVFFLQQY